MLDRRRHRRALAPLFDVPFYRAQLPEAPAGDPVDHYVVSGWQAGLDPAPWFSTAGYLADHADVRDAGLCPFLHYARYGRTEGRLVRRSAAAPGGHWQASGGGPQGPGEEGDRGPANPPAPTPARRRGPAGRRVRPRDVHAAAAALVDDRFYRARYPGLLDGPGGGPDGADGTDGRPSAAAWHFMAYGWTEGRDPAPWFSTAFYLRTNPDVAASGINPFVHYLAAGRREGRPCRDALAPYRDALLAQRPVHEVARTWLTGRDVAVRDVAHVPVPRGGAAGRDAGPRPGLLLAVGNDDYTANTGGVQECVRQEARAAAAAGRPYLYLFPDQPLPVLAPEGPDVALVPLLDGRRLPAVRTGDALALADRVAAALGAPLARVAVHGLLGHQPERLADQLAARPDLPVEYQVHDYSAACSGYTLMRSNVAACGAPPEGSASCRVCTHGAERPAHRRRVARLLDLPQVLPVAPSAAAAEVLASTGAVAADRVRVRPHGAVAWTGQRAGAGARRPVLAFVGYPILHKGWPVFTEVVSWAQSRGDVDVLHLGSVRSDRPDIPFHALDGGSGGEATRRLVELGADAVLVWPGWQETFSLVAHEALAAGCAVVTHPASGNVVRAARAHGRLVGFADADALRRAAATGLLARRLRGALAAPRRTGRFLFRTEPLAAADA